MTPKVKKDRYIDRSSGEIFEEETVRKYFNWSMGEYIESRCGTNGCYACSIWNAQRTSGAIKLAAPDYVLTLTLVGDSLQAIKKNIEKFVAKVRKTYPTFEYTWQAEENPRDTGTHCLLYIHLADEVLAASVVKNAWPHHFHLQPIPTRATATYFSYQFKDLADPYSRPSYLKLNGTPERQRIIHASRGFWRDGTTGKRLTRPQAEVLARRRARKPQRPRQTPPESSLTAQDDSYGALSPTPHLGDTEPLSVSTIR